MSVQFALLKTCLVIDAGQQPEDRLILNRGRFRELATAIAALAQRAGNSITIQVNGGELVVSRLSESHPVTLQWEEREAIASFYSDPDVSERWDPPRVHFEVANGEAMRLARDLKYAAKSR